MRTIVRFSTSNWQSLFCVLRSCKSNILSTLILGTIMILLFLRTAPSIMQDSTQRIQPINRDFFIECGLLRNNNWSQWPGLNRRPLPYHGSALPTELHWHVFCSQDFSKNRKYIQTSTYYSSKFIQPKQSLTDCGVRLQYGQTSLHISGEEFQ